jgi:hypothetical protein
MPIGWVRSKRPATNHPMACALVALRPTLLQRGRGRLSRYQLDSLAWSLRSVAHRRGHEIAGSDAGWHDGHPRFDHFPGNIIECGLFHSLRALPTLHPGWPAVPSPAPTRPSRIRISQRLHPRFCDRIDGHNGYRRTDEPARWCGRNSRHRRATLGGAQT